MAQFSTMKKLRKFLKEQFDYIATLAKECDPDDSIYLEVAEVVEECRRRCAEFGFTEIGEEATVLSPRSALVIVGQLCQWAREQKSKEDWLTPPQVAKMVGVKSDKVLYWIHSGQLQAVNLAQKEGGRPQYAVTPADLDIFKTRRSTRAAPKPRRARRESLASVYV